MRISDWSSDVCSSDLQAPDDVGQHRSVPARVGGGDPANAGPPPASGRELHARQPDHAIRMRNETLDFLVQRPYPGRVIEVDDRHFIIEDLARRVVARLAHLVVAALSRPVQLLVQLRVAVLRIVYSD